MDKKVILSVEDEEDVQELIVVSLTTNRKDYHILTAGSVAEALEVINRESHFDLALINLGLPAHGTKCPYECYDAGYFVAEEFRKKFKTVPLIMHTQSYHTGFPTGVEAFENAGYFFKPFEPNKIRSIVDKAIDLGQGYGHITP